MAFRPGLPVPCAVRVLDAFCLVCLRVLLRPPVLTCCFRSMRFTSNPASSICVRSVSSPRSVVALSDISASCSPSSLVSRPLNGASFFALCSARSPASLGSRLSCSFCFLPLFRLLSLRSHWLPLLLPSLLSALFSLCRASSAPVLAAPRLVQSLRALVAPALSFCRYFVLCLSVFPVSSLFAEGLPSQSGAPAPSFLSVRLVSLSSVGYQPLSVHPVHVI